MTYKKFFLYLISIFFSTFTSLAQVTFKITNVPRFYTPLNDKIYIAGNFNNWNAGDSAYQLTKNAQGEWEITFTPSVQQMEFKFTRGAWNRVEVNAAGADIPNRSFLGLPGASASFTISDWIDTRGNHSATGNTYQLQSEFFMPELNRHRRIWIYLPEDYFTNTSKRYPVLYMQDGQNLFDNATSFSGEWRIDETLRALQNQQGDGGAIVVGIDNGGSQRINEYSPYINPEYGGGSGNQYVDFLAFTLKPYIDANFRTMPDRNSTAIGGSSMGALISFFGALKHQNVFSKCLVFSPSFWFSDSLNQYVNSWTKTTDLRFYFMAGTNESTTMISNMQNMRTRLQNRGVPPSQINLVSRADGQHSEWFWAREFGEGYKWLFQDVTADIQIQESSIPGFNVFPNPNTGILKVQFDAKDEAIAEIYDSSGKLVIQQKVYTGQEVNVQNLPLGQYILTARLKKQTARAKIVLIK
jgi:metallo-beta-lactamase class B